MVKLSWAFPKPVMRIMVSKFAGLQLSPKKTHPFRHLTSFCSILVRKEEIGSLVLGSSRPGAAIGPWWVCLWKVSLAREKQSWCLDAGCDPALLLPVRCSRFGPHGFQRCRCIHITLPPCHVWNCQLWFLWSEIEMDLASSTLIPWAIYMILHVVSLCYFICLLEWAKLGYLKD